MNTSKVEDYAPQARRDFIAAVTDRAATYGLTAQGIEPVNVQGDVAIISGRPYPKTVATKRARLEQRVRRDGFEQAMEAIAYTWFNRLAALRYMELHGYLDHGYRVLSHPEGKAAPEILEHAGQVELPDLDSAKVIDLKLEGTKDAELYRMLLIGQCNGLSRVMPFLFEEIDDETELLLPDNLLHSDSLIRKLVREIPEEDWQPIEIIGWLYQFYISERKDEVMGRKKVVPKKDIPAVTQIFTPRWIVRYMVENSLGRLWLLNRPDSKLREHMPYYVEVDKDDNFLTINSPEEIRLIDPAVGSGHVLVYAFDLLYRIYEEAGYQPSEIPWHILGKNLYGLEIDERAAALAGFALMMKALEADHRFLRQSERQPVQPNITCLQDIRWSQDEIHWYLNATSLAEIVTGPAVTLLHQFEDAKCFGSLILPVIGEEAIRALRHRVVGTDHTGDLLLQGTSRKFLLLLDQATILCQRFHCAVTNPPYMGRSQMNPSLKGFIESEWRDGQSDSYAAFALRNLTFVKPHGWVGMITIPNWLTIDRFEEFRRTLLRSSYLASLIHCGRGIWGSDFGSCAFVFRAGLDRTRVGVFRRLFHTSGEVQSNEEIQANFFALDEFPKYLATSDAFESLPGTPIAFWASPSVRRLFTNDHTVESAIDTREGLATADNDRFLRRWFEVSKANTFVRCDSLSKARDSGKKWFPYVKGGEFRKWFGNTDLVVNWQNDGEAIRRNLDPTTGRIRSHNYNGEYAFREGLTWSGLSIGGFAVRFVPGGFKFDAKGPMGFPRDGSNLYYVMGFLNSVVAQRLLQILAPTVDFKIGMIQKLPLVIDRKLSDTISRNSSICVQLAQEDWNSSETSWGFQCLPVLGSQLKDGTLETSWKKWSDHCAANIARMKELEETNNRLLIDAYGLTDELCADVPEDQITLTSADRDADGKAFLSYAVGCIMGRYSVDGSGLVLANQGETVADYLAALDKAASEVRFLPDPDAIMPVLDRDWFRDDVVARVAEFLRVSFGEATLAQNALFLEESIGKDLRRYFASDFFKDHLKTYKKRPIYWLFSSGKQRAFQALVYLHRYNEGTLARMRTEYVIPLQGMMSSRIQQLGEEIEKVTSSAQRNKLEKERDKLLKQRPELQEFDEKLRHYADMRISLDLDDGVKGNYANFGDLLAEVKTVTGGDDE
jgi:hypothetical protein